MRFEPRGRHESRRTATRIPLPWRTARRVPVVPLTDPVLAARRSRIRRAVLAALVATAVLGGGFAELLQPRSPRPPVGRRQVPGSGTSGAHHTSYRHAGRPASDSLAWVLSASRD